MDTMTAAVNHASGDWRVRTGCEDEFVGRWTEFLQWTWENAPGFLRARLIQDPEEPAHFISFAEWESPAGLQAWRRLPDFATRLGACRALCEDFRGSNYRLVIQVPLTLVEPVPTT